MKIPPLANALLAALTFSAPVLALPNQDVPRFGPPSEFWHSADRVCCEDSQAISGAVYDPRGFYFLRRGTNSQGVIEKRDRHFALLQSIAEAPAGIRELKLGLDGRLYAATATAIKAYDVDLNQTGSIPIVTTAFDVLSDGAVVYSDGTRVYVAGPTGTPITDWAFPESTFIDLIAVRGDRILVWYNHSNTTQQTAQIYDRNGSLRSTIDLGDVGFGGLTRAPDGRVWLRRCLIVAGIDRVSAFPPEIQGTTDTGNPQVYERTLENIDRNTSTGANADMVVGFGGELIVYRRSNDLLTSMHRFRAGFIGVAPRVASAPPRPDIVGIARRPSSSVLDVDYRVLDEDSPQLTTSVFALVEGQLSLDAYRPITALIEGTASNVGPSIASGTTLRLTWDAGADLGTAQDFLNVQVHVQAKDDRDLLDLDLIRIPNDVPTAGDPVLVISRSPFTDQDFLEVWFWLLSRHDPALRIDTTTGTVYGVGGAYDNVALASGTTTTSQGRSFLFGRLGVVEATAGQISRARQGAAAGPIVQYAPRNQMGSRPQAVNMFGFDTGAASGYWVVVP